MTFIMDEYIKANGTNALEIQRKYKRLKIFTIWTLFAAFSSKLIQFVCCFSPGWVKHKVERVIWEFHPQTESSHQTIQLLLQMSASALLVESVSFVLFPAFSDMKYCIKTQIGLDCRCYCYISRSLSPCRINRLS